MNKNCVGCTKIFTFDESINPNRKFCGKKCYTNYVRRRPEVPTQDKMSRVETVRDEKSQTQKKVNWFFKMFLGE